MVFCAALVAASSLPHSVEVVVALSSEPQVIGVHAGRRIAFMENGHSGRYRAAMDNP